MTLEDQKHTYGTQDSIIMQVPASAFHPADSGIALQEDGSGYVYATGGSGRLFAPLNLPNGALVNFLDLYYDDTNGASDPSAVLFEFTGTSSPVVNNVATVSSAGASSGAGYNFHLINPALQINNNNQYMIYVFSTDSTKKFKGVNVWYRLQVSPAPATATFSDVPTSYTYFRAIEALAASGITTGCGGGNFCPNGNVTRGEMAAFLARALGLHFPF